MGIPPEKPPSDKRINRITSGHNRRGLFMVLLVSYFLGRAA
jgi:hypothetical protein